MYFCGIDPGLTNFALCIIQDEPFEIVYLERCNLFQTDDGRVAKFDPKLTTHFCNAYFERHEHVFRNVAVTLIENQMQRKMLTVQYSMETLFQRHGSAISIHPSTIKAYYKTSKKHYAANKNAAIVCCRNLLEGDNLARFNACVGQAKADDVADAVLLAIYASRRRDQIFSPPDVPRPPKRRSKANKRRKTS